MCSKDRVGKDLSDTFPTEKSL